MRKFFTLLSREIRSYFYSPIAYIVLVFFLLVSGVDFYFQVSFMNQRAIPYSVQEAFFNSVFFWFAFVLIFPLITMRLFSEEFKLGTIEPLVTAPVRDWQPVLEVLRRPLSSSSGFRPASTSSSSRRSPGSRQRVRAAPISVAT
jgi:ABC-2 type transport system permease protein